MNKEFRLCFMTFFHVWRIVHIVWFLDSPYMLPRVHRISDNRLVEVFASDVVARNVNETEINWSRKVWPG